MQLLIEIEFAQVINNLVLRLEIDHPILIK